MAFENFSPAPFMVFAELTGNSGGCNDKGYTYRVRGRRDESKPIGKQLRRLDTLEAAEDAIAADIESNRKPNTFGGLVDWGKAAPREYAIFECTVKRVK